MAETGVNRCLLGCFRPNTCAVARSPGTLPSELWGLPSELLGAMGAVDATEDAKLWTRRRMRGCDGGSCGCAGGCEDATATELSGLVASAQQHVHIRINDEPSALNDTMIEP